MTGLLQTNRRPVRRAVLSRGARRLGLALGLVLFLTLGIAHKAQALVFDEDGKIAANEVIDDDVVIFADTVVVDGVVNGALIASGESVTINGVINGDLVIWGASIDVNGKVTGNLIMGGQAMTVNGSIEMSLFSWGASTRLTDKASIGRNAWMMGWNLETMPGSSIGRDLVLGSTQALLSGKVERDISGATQAFNLRGRVGRNVNITVEEDDGILVVLPVLLGSPLATIGESGLHVYPEAVIGGELTYTSTKDYNQNIQAAPGGNIIFRKLADLTPKPTLAEQATGWLVGCLQDIVTFAALGGLALWKLPGGLSRLTEKAARPIQAAGWGLLAAVGGYFGAILLLAMVVLAGVMLWIIYLNELALIVLFAGVVSVLLVIVLFTLFVSYGSKLVVASLLGRWLFRRFSSQPTAHPFWPLLIGVVVYVILRAIPIGLLGWVIGVLATLVGTGAMWLAWRTRRKVEG